MTKEERKAWVARGYRDPVQAYRTHAASAAQRGIEFKLTFDQWWALWEPHYPQRGRNVGQKQMCRTGDTGAYEAGNVRIDTVQGNADERSQVYRKRNTDAGRMPLSKDRLPSLSAQDPTGWIGGRNMAFRPYVESDEDYDT